MNPKAPLGAAEIFAPLPPVEWVCQALDFAPGAPMLVAGYGYSGKTVAMQDVALAAATGGKAWGAFQMKRGRVLHLDYEQGAYLTCMRYQRLARARGLTAADLDGRLTLATFPDWYLDGDVGDKLTKMCEGVDLLIVDSFRAAFPITDENSSEARIPLDRLTRLSEETGVASAVIHHARKPSQNSSGGARMTVRGSGALYDACGSVLVFASEKGQPIKVAHEKARISGRTHGDFTLSIEDVSIDDNPEAGLRVSFHAIETAAAASPGEKFDHLKAQIVKVLGQEAFVGGTTALRARIGGRQADVSAAVRELVGAGYVEPSGTARQPIYRLSAMGKAARGL